MNIRTARPETDIPGIAAVVNAFESPPVTLGIVQEWFTQTAPGRITQFEQWVCNSSWYRPDGQLIAMDGEEWVGMCTIQLRPETQGAYNVHTGVVRSHRGRKIALAIKLVAIRYARAHGVQTLHTNNDSFNAPMLAINRKLGYRPQPGKYMLRGSNTHWHNLAKNAIL